MKLDAHTIYSVFMLSFGFVVGVFGAIPEVYGYSLGSIGLTLLLLTVVGFVIYYWIKNREAIIKELEEKSSKRLNK